MIKSTLQPYLFFHGRCEEAIEFYRSALGAETTMLMRFEDTPDPKMKAEIKPGMEKKIMHAHLVIGGAHLLVSDGNCAETEGFNGFSLSLAFLTEAEVRNAWDALVVGGEVHMPLMRTFWSPCFGMLADKFGVGWMLSVEEPSQS